MLTLYIQFNEQLNKKEWSIESIGLREANQKRLYIAWFLSREISRTGISSDSKQIGGYLGVRKGDR